MEFLNILTMVFRPNGQNFNELIIWTIISKFYSKVKDIHEKKIFILLIFLKIVGKTAPRSVLEDETKDKSQH